MKDTIFLLIKMEIEHPFTKVHEAIAELQEKAVCQISDTEHVRIVAAKVMDYKLKQS